MDYLVIIDNTPHFHWQAELLIESFKMKGLEDKLAIGIVDNRSKQRVNHTRNLIDHKRNFSFKGRTTQYDPSNFPYGAYLAIKEEIIKQPFVLLHADTILLKPIEAEETNVTFSRDDDPLEEILEHTDFKTYFNLILKRREIPTLNISPVGGICQFNDIPPLFFEQMIMWADSLTNKWSERNWKYINKAALMLTLTDFLGILTLQGKNYEVPLIAHLGEHNFIHYSKGLPPHFHKSMFTYSPTKVAFSNIDNPFQVLLENNPTTTTDYVQNVINSYKRRKT